ncbi:MAG: hypothetical protein A2Y07_02170 [Planctomycetes bacterium GWF2_50_10]|nr:MAG: hypothetical protein A2Y07_02170 [Planctomycetes bacterium GWF2_50_10]
MKNYSKGFTLVELLVVISILALLLSILMPALGMARERAQSTICIANLRQIGFAVQLYANDYSQFFPPAYESSTDTHWWGQKTPTGIDHQKSFTWSYLTSTLKRNGLFECPSQKLGTYKFQGKPDNMPDGPKWITSTYGYNGYYLTPAKTSGWATMIGNRPWQRSQTVIHPAQVFVFADTMLDRDPGAGSAIENCALLDPPQLFMSGSWQKNDYPTTSFRHNLRTNGYFADGHAQSTPLPASSAYRARQVISSVGHDNDCYVPDWRSWVTGRRPRQ